MEGIRRQSDLILDKRKKQSHKFPPGEKSQGSFRTKHPFSSSSNSPSGHLAERKPEPEPVKQEEDEDDDIELLVVIRDGVQIGVKGKKIKEEPEGSG